MNDPDSTIRGQRNALERLVQLVPGFRGYYDRENRREADRLVRHFGVSRLDRILEDLHGAVRGADLDGVGDLEPVIADVERLQNELRHADQGYSGFFDEVKWDDEELLEMVYLRDLELVERIDQLSGALRSGQVSAEQVRDRVRDLRCAFDDRRSELCGSD